VTLDETKSMMHAALTMAGIRHDSHSISVRVSLTERHVTVILDAKSGNVGYNELVKLATAIGTTNISFGWLGETRSWSECTPGDPTEVTLEIVWLL